MPLTSLEQIIPELRDAIGPVILISGVGLLLLTMTNRLGRAIDRSRQLTDALAGLSGHELTQTLAQIRMIYRRARLLRVSILFAAFSVLLVAVLIVTLFLAAWVRADAPWLNDFICGVFIACLASLFISLAAFIHDINLSLHALKLELQDHKVEVNGNG